MSRTTRSPSRAARHATLARGVVTRNGQSLRRGRLSGRRTSVVLLSASLHDQLQAVSVVRRRVFVAGALATAFAVAPRLRRREPLHAPDPAARGRRPSASRRATSTSPSSTTAPTSSASSPARSSGCGSGSRISTARAASSSRTPRTSSARRSSRSAGSSSCSTTRTSTSRPGGVPRPDARAGGAPDEARDRPARPLARGRRPARVARETIDLAELAERAGGRVRPAGRRVGAPLEAVERRRPAHGDAERVLQIGRVLVENALVHTPPGTTVRRGRGA